MSLESTGSRCEQLARQLQVFGRVIPTAETVARLNAVTLADVRRAAARLFRARPTLATHGSGGRACPRSRRSPRSWRRDRRRRPAARPDRPRPPAGRRCRRTPSWPPEPRSASSAGSAAPSMSSGRRAGSRPAGLRRPAGRDRLVERRPTPAASIAWPSARSPWRGSCRKTPMAAWREAAAVRPARSGSLDLADPAEPDTEALVARASRGRGGGARPSRHHQFGRRGGRLQPHHARPRDLGRVCRPLHPHQPLRLRHRARGRGHGHAAGLRLFLRRASRGSRGRAGDRPFGRAPGRRPAQSRPPEDDDPAGRLRPARRGRPARASHRRDQRRLGRPRHDVPQGQARPAHPAGRHQRAGRSSPGARLAVAAVRRRRRPDHRRAPRGRRRADDMAARQPDRPAARHAHDRPRRPRWAARRRPRPAMSAWRRAG